MKSYGILLGSAALFAAATCWAAPREVKTGSGVVKGAAKHGVVSYKGIPFAQPPVGDLRWRPPQPPQPWTGVRPALEFGPDCMQKLSPGDAAPLGKPPAEDCLYLNVWTPEGSAEQKRAVMVWIYGGGFVNGGSSPPEYDGSQFARRGVVLVSFNYRLGRFGFFAHPALTRESPSGPLGNYGYLDQIAALQWVRKNIETFGGDPQNVTIFGESAGGGSVLTMLTSPLATGLFQKAIIESGGGRNLLMGPRYLDHASRQGQASAEAVGVAFGKSVGISGESPADLAALRALPAYKIVAGLNMATMGTPTYAGPMVDGKIVVETPGEAYAAGHGAKVPLMAGATNADIGFAFGKTKDELFARLEGDAAKAKTLYDPDGSLPLRRVGSAFGADQMMVEPARFIVRALAAAGQPVFEFRFSYVAESRRKQWAGAPHSSEIPFVFDTVAAHYGNDLTPADEATAKAANEYWANFAKRGDPNGRGLPEWPKYELGQDRLMDFSLTGPVAKADPWKNRLDLVERHASQ